MRPACSAPPGEARRSTSGWWARWTSSPPRWARRSAARPAGSPARSAAVCDYLTQRARPQLFSNALPPTVAASSLASIEYLEAHPERVTRLRENAGYFRERLLELGFKPLPGETPIIPVILGRDRGRHPDERPAARRRGFRDRLRLSRSCRRGRPACAARSPPRTPGTISTRRSPPSPRSGDSSASFSSARFTPAENLSPPSSFLVGASRVPVVNQSGMHRLLRGDTAARPCKKLRTASLHHSAHLLHPHPSRRAGKLPAGALQAIQHQADTSAPVPPPLPRFPAQFAHFDVPPLGTR